MSSDQETAGHAAPAPEGRTVKNSDSAFMKSLSSTRRMNKNKGLEQKYATVKFSDTHVPQSPCRERKQRKPVLYRKKAQCKIF